MCSGTAFNDYADYTMPRRVGTPAGAEWFEKGLVDPDDSSTFSLLPGVAVKNIAILHSKLTGTDLICVALYDGANDQSKGKRKVNMPQLVFLHMCCANYDSHVAKSGAQFQSKRECFVADRYRMGGGSCQQSCGYLNPLRNAAYGLGAVRGRESLVVGK